MAKYSRQKILFAVYQHYLGATQLEVKEFHQSTFKLLCPSNTNSTQNQDWHQSFLFVCFSETQGFFLNHYTFKAETCKQESITASFVKSAFIHTLSGDADN